MKITVIGDIHGRSLWKDIVRSEADADKFIFLGDYADARDPGISPRKQLDNLLEILEFKKSAPDRCVLLLGNHDVHYAGDVEPGSGWSLEARELFRPVFRENEENFAILHKHGDILFSHAGLSEDWMRLCVRPDFPDITLEDMCGPLDENRIRIFSEGTARFGRLGFNMYTGWDLHGDSTGNGPVWIRPGALSGNWYRFAENTVQVAGHTPVKKLSGIPFKSGERSMTLWLCDALGNSEYLVIDGPEFMVGKLT